ncbi:MAG: hypothetical protein ABL895_18815 [Cyclobacteriaceae bacterium]
MNKVVKYRLTLFLTLALFAGCQEEKIEITLPPTDAVITKMSPAAGLMARLATKDGSKDNILDQASCISIVFPVTVEIDNKNIILNSEDDLDQIEEIFDAASDDEDVLDFIYPIKVTLADFTEILVVDEDALEDLIDQCKSDDDIECVDFIYPLEIKVYDTKNQISDVVTITNDTELYNFLRLLNEQELVSITFPVKLIKADGTILSIDNYQDLEEAIEDSEDDCDEDDDNDYNDDDADDSGLIGALITGIWKVDSFIDPTDRTNEWTDYILTFSADGTLTATKNTTTLTGTWSTDGDDGELELTLALNANDPLDDINEDWTVLEFTSTIIKLDDSDDETSTLVLKQL